MPGIVIQATKSSFCSSSAAKGFAASVGDGATVTYGSAGWVVCKAYGVSSAEGVSVSSAVGASDVTGSTVGYAVAVGAGAITPGVLSGGLKTSAMEAYSAASV